MSFGLKKINETAEAATYLLITDDCIIPALRGDKPLYGDIRGHVLWDKATDMPSFIQERTDRAFWNGQNLYLTRIRNVILQERTAQEPYPPNAAFYSCS